MSAASPQPDGNRKDPRARVLNMTVRYRSATVDEFIENHSHDISRGGMFIKTRSPFPAGTLLKFEVRIAEDQKLMHGVGRVVWRRDPQEGSEEPPSGMGIKFIKTGEGASALIGQLVNARKGKESNFEAGVRENDPDTKNASAQEAGSQEELGASGLPVESSRVTLPPPESSEAIESLDNGPTHETEILVSSPPKARANHSPERRKVVLQDEPKPQTTSKEDTRGTSEPPETLPPKADRPDESDDSTISPRAAAAALATADAPKSGSSAANIFALIAVAAGAWLLFKPSTREQVAPEQLTHSADSSHGSSSPSSSSPSASRAGAAGETPKPKPISAQVAKPSAASPALGTKAAGPSATGSLVPGTPAEPAPGASSSTPNDDKPANGVATGTSATAKSVAGPRAVTPVQTAKPKAPRITRPKVAVAPKPVAPKAAKPTPPKPPVVSAKPVVKAPSTRAQARAAVANVAPTKPVVKKPAAPKPITAKTTTTQKSKRASKEKSSAANSSADKASTNKAQPATAPAPVEKARAGDDNPY